jgi:hypothetical protein
VIRPSSLTLAKHCRKSAELAGPGNANTARGAVVDQQVSAALSGGPEPTDETAAAIVAAVRDRYPGARLVVQTRVQLIDPATGEVLTEGTPDIIVLPGDPKTEVLEVLDMKRRGQRLGGYLPAPGESDQLLAYGIAACQALRVSRHRATYVLFDEGPVAFEAGPVVEPAAWRPFIRAYKAVDAAPVEYTTGEHCARCWNRLRCEAYLLPAVANATPALQPFASKGAALTASEAERAWEWLLGARLALRAGKELADAVEEQLMEYGRAGGRIGNRVLVQVTKPGRRSGATVAELEQAGRPDLIKAGKPTTAWEWQAQDSTEAA